MTKDEIIKEAVFCLKQLPDMKMNGSRKRISVFELVKELEKHIKEEKPSKFKQLDIWDS